MFRTVLALTAIAAAAKSPPQPDEIIRTSVRLVQVNVVVHDRSGPVANLTKADFTLTDRGKPRPIDLFSVETAGIAERTSHEPLPANTFSNRQGAADAASPNVTVVLLDALNTTFEDRSYAKRALLKFLEAVDPRDRIALYTLDSKLRVLCDFTDGGAELRRILGAFRRSTSEPVSPSDPGATGNAMFNQFLDESSHTIEAFTTVNRARTTMQAFAEIAGHVANIPGRKTLIWVTGSLPLSLAGMAGAFNRANLAVYPVDARGLVGMPRQATASMPPELFHSGPPTVLRTFAPDGLVTMQELADLTGGRAFYNGNDLNGALRTALADASVSYTLGFYPDPGSLDGKLHEIKVEAVAHPDWNLRYRKAYVAVNEAQTSDEQIRRNLLAALASPLESAAVALSAKLERRKQALAVSLNVDARNLQLSREGLFSNGAINLFFIQQDETGRTIDRTEAPVDLHLTRQQYEAYLRSGLAINKLVVVKDAARVLRILCVDRSDGSVGSLIIPLAQVK